MMKLKIVRFQSAKFEQKFSPLLILPLSGVSVWGWIRVLLSRQCLVDEVIERRVVVRERANGSIWALERERLVNNGGVPADQD